MTFLKKTNSINNMKNTNKQIVVEYKINFRSQARTLPVEYVMENYGAFTKSILLDGQLQEKFRKTIMLG